MTTSDDAPRGPSTSAAEDPAPSAGEGPARSGPPPSQQALDHMAALARLGPGTMNEHMGVQITEASADRVVGSLPVDRNTQPYGLLHGGASVALAETLSSYGSALLAGPDRIAVGIEINASHHRSVSDGRVVGVATPVQVGRTLCTWQVTISDEQGRRVCTARITCLLRDRLPR